MKDKTPTAWKFVNADAEFTVRNPERTSYLYFPLTNDGGLKSSVTPELQGDAKVDQNRFLLTPVSVEDLHHSSYGRNFWLHDDCGNTWSVNGRSPAQRQAVGTDSGDVVTLDAGFLWHRVNRENKSIGFRAEVTSFVPAGCSPVELMKVRIINIGDSSRRVIPTAAIPIFGRSADNLRDHRHVTSLLHRIYTTQRGIVVRPTLSFDERGHRLNKTSYGVCGADADGSLPVGYFPILHDFTGEGGCLDWPAAVVENLPVTAVADRYFEGYEAVGAIRFAEKVLAPGETAEYLLVLGVGESEYHREDWEYLDSAAFDESFTNTKKHWREKLGTLNISTGNVDFDRWFKWVTLQPVLRRIYGCSFLPYHDYGRGGRGWRDLWQDCLALLLMEPDGVGELLLSNFAGVRMDGSNATIIGEKSGEFLADRNCIARVWMDHGSWPWLTTRLYIDQTGDCEFLFKDQVYFRDCHIKRCREKDERWDLTQGVRHRTKSDKAYQGTVVEHLLIQHLTAFYNVGKHNNILLEGADWNDGLDMARDQGESVTFSAMYGGNLLEIADILEIAGERIGKTTIELGQELAILLDTTGSGINYESVTAKRELLNTYMNSILPVVSGRKVEVTIAEVAADLRRKGEWVLAHIRKKEWIRNSEGFSWFNGYYDDGGNRLEGDHQNGVRMTLPGQVFTLLSGTATDEQVSGVVDSVNRYLWDDAVGGCRLNTDFGEVLMDMGRCYGFAFGHKENGAMFCHMAVMYAYALFARKRTEEGWKVLSGIHRQSMDFEKSRIFPGIPEYFDARGRGMYSYLTGSASWYLLTMRNQVFGVRGCVGDLVLDPQMPAELFDEAGEACVETCFADRQLRIIYCRKSGDAGKVSRVSVSGKDVDWEMAEGEAVIVRSVLESLQADAVHEIRVELN